MIRRRWSKGYTSDEVMVTQKEVRSNKPRTSEPSARRCRRNSSLSKRMHEPSIGNRRGLLVPPPSYSSRCRLPSICNLRLPKEAPRRNSINLRRARASPEFDITPMDSSTRSSWRPSPLSNDQRTPTCRSSERDGRTNIRRAWITRWHLGVHSVL